MAQTTIGFGIGMILLGVVSYFATGQQSVTALIPAFFGIVFLILKRYAWGPILGMLEERRIRIASEVKASEDLRREAEELKAEYGITAHDIAGAVRGVIKRK